MKSYARYSIMMSQKKHEYVGIDRMDHHFMIYWSQDYRLIIEGICLFVIVAKLDPEMMNRLGHFQQLHTLHCVSEGVQLISALETWRVVVFVSLVSNISDMDTFIMLIVPLFEKHVLFFHFLSLYPSWLWCDLIIFTTCIVSIKNTCLVIHRYCQPKLHIL